MRLESLDESTLRGWRSRTLAGLATARVLLDEEFRRHVCGLVALIDLDRFARYNARHGVRTGDALLAEIERALHRAVLKRGHCLALGGDQFLVVFSDHTEGAEVGRHLLDTVRGARARSQWARRGVTGSAGLAGWPNSGTTPRDALSAARRALAVAKFAGGNHWTDASRAVRILEPGQRDTGTPATFNLSRGASPRPRMSCGSQLDVENRAARPRSGRPLRRQGRSTTSSPTRLGWVRGLADRKPGGLLHHCYTRSDPKPTTGFIERPKHSI